MSYAKINLYICILKGLGHCQAWREASATRLAPRTLKTTKEARACAGLTRHGGLSKTRYNKTMKKLLVALSLLCAFALETVAQTEFHWGFKGGLNFTTYDSDADDVQARMGQWGVLCRWNIGEHFAIQPELFYARMGVRSLKKLLKAAPAHDSFSTEGSLQNEWFRIMLLTDNVQLPIIFKYYLPVDVFGGKGLNVHAGPLFSQRFDYKISTPNPEGFLQDPLLSGNGSIQYNADGSITRRYDNDLRNFARSMNQFTVHAVWGVGYDSPSGIGVDIRCQMGITPVWNSSKNHVYNSNSHDRVWALCFNYTF